MPVSSLSWWSNPTFSPAKEPFVRATFPWICYCDNFLGKVLSYSTETIVLQAQFGGALTVPASMKVAILDCADEFVGSFDPPSRCASRYPFLTGSLNSSAVRDACVVEYNMTYQQEEFTAVSVVGSTGCSTGPSNPTPPPSCSSFQFPYFFEAYLMTFRHPEKCPFFYSATQSGLLQNIRQFSYLGCMGCYNGENCVGT